METMIFKRMNVNSTIKFCSRFGEQHLQKELEELEKDNLILQIVSVPYQEKDNDYFLIEYIKRPSNAEAEKIYNEHYGDIDFENYLDTVINKDPFGAKYSGKKIREVFENGDAKWLETALKELRNEFIRDRLQYIVDRGGYGKIQC